MMNKVLSAIVISAAMYACPAMHAQATTIDFSALAEGTAVTSQYAGVTFSLGGRGDSSGPPTTGAGSTGPGGLTNTSYSGDYPSAEFLIASFSPTVTGLSFVFNNRGFNGGNRYTLYDASHAIITSALMDMEGDITYNLQAYTGVSEIIWSNGTANEANSYWWQTLNVISFTEEAAASIPEPGSFALFGIALAGCAALRRRRSN
jgi:PEP-CTERM motif